MTPRIVLDLGEYSVDPYDMSGISLRALELAETLAGSFRVSVFSPGSRASVRGSRLDIHVDPAGWPALLASARVAMFFDMPNISRLEDAARSNVKIVSENAPPIEQLEYPRFLARPDSTLQYEYLVSTYRRQLELSHHFLCRSRIERAVLLGNLCLLGRLRPTDVAISRTVDHLITTVPIGFSRGSSQRAADAQARPVADFVWSGGLWTFYNPDLLIRAIHTCHRRGCFVTLAFLYAVEVTDNVDILHRIRSLISELDLGTHIHLLSAPLPHDERDALLKGAKGQICIGLPGIENETCVRLRIRDSRLYGLPMVIDRHGASATEVLDDEIGVVLEEDSPEVLADLLIRLMNRETSPPLQRYCYEDTITAFQHWIHTKC